MSDIDIIMRTKDRPVLLRRALQSVASQDHDSFTLIVINDGGDQLVFENAIEEFKVFFGERLFTISNKQSLGMEAASNKAIANGNSPLIVIHDDDDSWQHDFLSQTVSRMKFLEGKNFVGCATWARLITEKIEGETVLQDSSSRYKEFTEVDPRLMLRENFIPPISLVFMRAAWLDLSGFNESLPVLGDWEFNMRLLGLGKLSVITEELANYHQRLFSTGNYGNTVVASRDLHYMTRQEIERSLFSELVSRDLPMAFFLVNPLMSPAASPEFQTSDFSKASEGKSTKTVLPILDFFTLPFRYLRLLLSGQSSNNYKSRYKDVPKLWPRVHFVIWGRKEGRHWR